VSNDESRDRDRQPGRPTSIRQRLLVQSVVTLGLLLLAALLIFLQVSRLLNAIAVLETAAERVRIVGEVRTDSTALLGTVSRLLPLQDSAVFSRDVSAVLTNLEASQAELLALLETEGDDEVVQSLSEVAARVGAIVSLSRTMVLQAQDQQWTGVQVRVGVLNRDQQQIAAEINRLVAQVRAGQEAAIEEVAAARQAVIIYPAIVGLFTLLFTVIALVDIYRRIGGPVAALTSGAGRLASGHFDERVQVPSNDEMGELAEAFNTMASELQATYGVLEERVQRRTQDLALAAEVGQRLSLVRDLDQLLTEAVSRIRERFDLYYTQVYLVDEAGRNLLLHAGTGSVGEELMRRSFRLPIDRTSINGTAALEKNAVIIPDTTASRIFRPNILLPDTRSEMAVPLLLGDQVLGVLDLQSSEPGALTGEGLPAFEVLAGQLAIAVENARLFSQVEAARRAAAGAARHRVREGWQQYLNALERKEFLGYDYTGADVLPLEQPFTVGPPDPSENVLAWSIMLHGEEIGAIELLADPDRDWTAEEVELVNGVSEQIAQQVENLRLVAESQHYRDEAETALKRATREGWAQVAAAAGQVLAYRYEGGQVQPARPEADSDSEAVSLPLEIRGEPIGELLLPQAAGDRQATRLVGTIAERLSAHIENLRLSQQTEQALAEAERRSAEQALLNRVVSEISATLDLRHSLNIVVQALVEATGSDQARVALRRPGRSKLVVVAEAHDPQRTPSAIGMEIPIEANPLTQQVISQRKPVLVSAAQTSPEAEPIRDMLQEQGIETIWLMPIAAGNEIVGTVGIDLLDPGKRFSAEEQQLAESIVLQAGTAIQNARLFEQVQETLAATERLYQASARLNAAADLQEAVAAVAGGGRHPAIDRVVLFLLEHDADGDLVAITSAATWHSGKGPEPTPVGTRYEKEAMAALDLLVAGEPLFVDDIEADERGDPATKAVFRELGIRSVVILPLTARGRHLGSLLLEGGAVERFVPEEFEPYLALAGQLALALDRQMLLTSAQRRAERERLINVIGQKIQSAPTIEGAMQVALTELGQALQARRGYVALSAATGANGDQEPVVTE
jgi:GAF domain-containing protein/HAMP domain-containing protein